VTDIPGVVTSRTFVCRRCSREETIQNTTGQPQGWGAVTTTFPPLADFEGERMLLCGDDWSAFSNWINNDGAV
jgi:hypothetical protein